MRDRQAEQISRQPLNATSGPSALASASRRASRRHCSKFHGDSLEIGQSAVDLVDDPPGPENEAGEDPRLPAGRGCVRVGPRHVLRPSDRTQIPIRRLRLKPLSLNWSGSEDLSLAEPAFEELAGPRRRASQSFTHTGRSCFPNGRFSARIHIKASVCLQGDRLLGQVHLLT